MMKQMLSLPCLHPLGTHLYTAPDYSKHLQLSASYRDALDLYPGQVGRARYLMPLDSLLNQRQGMAIMDKYTSFHVPWLGYLWDVFHTLS